jgi:hypothetical protein
MSLEEAVNVVGPIERDYRNSPIERELAAKLIGYSSLSGPANKALAALASYGLIERAGKGEVRVTERARAILHSDTQEERRENLRAAAQEPHLFRQLRGRFSEILVPPEEGVISYLRRQNFNESAIKPAARAFLDTAKYLEQNGATESYGSEPSAEPESPSPMGQTARFGGAKVGDWIQWESQGMLQFKTPQRVRHVSEDGEWVAVEGSQTGLPMSEVIVEQRASDPPHEPQKKAPSFPLESGSEHAEGEEWMRSRVGTDVQVQLFVKGEMGPKEISKLIKLLEAQKEVLED